MKESYLIGRMKRYKFIVFLKTFTVGSVAVIKYRAHLIGESCDLTQESKLWSSPDLIRRGSWWQYLRV